MAEAAAPLALSAKRLCRTSTRMPTLSLCCPLDGALRCAMAMPSHRVRLREHGLPQLCTLERAGQLRAVASSTGGGGGRHGALADGLAQYSRAALRRWCAAPMATKQRQR